MYNPAMGRFMSRDTWEGDYNRPLSLNHWMYVEGNPINRTDPSGMCYKPDGTVNWWGWPWGKSRPCIVNVSGPTMTLTPTIAAIVAAATACQTPTSTSTVTFTPTATFTPTNTPLPTPTGRPIEKALYYLQTYSRLGKTLYDQSVTIGVIFDYNPDRCAGQSQGKKIWVSPCGTPTYDAGTIAHEMFHILKHSQHGSGSKYEEYGAMLVGDTVRSEIISNNVGTPADMRNPISVYTVDLNNPNQAQLEQDLIAWFTKYEPTYNNLRTFPPTPTPSP